MWSALSCLPCPHPHFLPEDGGQVMTVFVQKPPSPAFTVGFNIKSPPTHPDPGHIWGVGGKALFRALGCPSLICPALPNPSQTCSQGGRGGPSSSPTALRSHPRPRRRHSCVCLSVILEILPLCLDLKAASSPGTCFCLITSDLSFSSNAECVRICCFLVSWNQGHWEASAMGVATRSSVHCQPPRAPGACCQSILFSMTQFSSRSTLKNLLCDPHPPHTHTFMLNCVISI